MMDAGGGGIVDAGAVGSIIAVNSARVFRDCFFKSSTIAYFGAFSPLLSANYPGTLAEDRNRRSSSKGETA